MSDSHEPAQNITPEKIGAVVGAVIGGYFGPIGAGIGAFAGLTIASAYLGSYESTPSRAPHS